MLRCDALQKSVDIGNELPGLKIKSLYLGGIPGHSNEVLQGFRGCIQVGVTFLSVVLQQFTAWHIIHLY